MSGVTTEWPDHLPRRVKIVLVSPGGDILGALPSVDVSTPFWNDIPPITDALQKTFGISATILRMLDLVRHEHDYVEVTYLAETTDKTDLEKWDGKLTTHPLRLPYAEVGGPKADMDWASSVLKSKNIDVTGKPEQIRTWNLSSIWRIPAGERSVWLKHVPPFFAHEGAMIDAMRGKAVPELLGHDGARILLEEIPGVDMYDATLDQLKLMVSSLVEIQDEWTNRIADLENMGLPDWRGEFLSTMIEDVFARDGNELSQDDRHVLKQFIRTLPQRFADVAGCGLSDTMVHGDFHPGNIRAEGLKLTILDWGDSGIGHPMLDQSACLERCNETSRTMLKDHWNNEWLRRYPSSDPARASQLLSPIASARQAVIYRRFMDGIEPSEHVYHQKDPLHWLHETALILQQA